MIVFLLRLLLKFPFAFEHENVVLYSHIEVFRVHSRRFNFDDNIAVGFKDVDGWVPFRCRHRSFPILIQEPAETSRKQIQFTKRIPLDQRHGSTSFPPVTPARWVPASSD